MAGLTQQQREALLGRVMLNWPFEPDSDTADEVRDIADGVAVEVERIVKEHVESALTDALHPEFGYIYREDGPVDVAIKQALAQCADENTKE